MPQFASTGIFLPSHTMLCCLYSAKAANEINSQCPIFPTADCCDLSVGRVSWYDEGVLNVTESCVDRHMGKGKIALIYEKDEPGTQEYVTYEVKTKNLFLISSSPRNCLYAKI